MTKLPLRPNVCILVYNHEKRLLLGERFGSPNIWQFPQGGVEEGSSLEANVVRELQEELGIMPEQLGKIEQLAATHEYDWENPPAYAKGRWRGQAQTFWLVEYTGTDQQINLTAHTDPEFMSWRWCTVQEVEKLAEPRRLSGYRKPLSEVSKRLRC